MILEQWGATREEIASAVIGDDLCPNARIIATRCITIAAPPEAVFPWLRQMGFGRAGWYSYDWIDNLGRRSATTVHAEWQDVESGARVPGGPVSFTAAIVQPPNGFVLQLGRSDERLCFTLAYELRPIGAGTRLVTRMRTRIRVRRFESSRGHTYDIVDAAATRCANVRN